jgi:hypothetical protein
MPPSSCACACALLLLLLSAPTPAAGGGGALTTCACSSNASSPAAAAQAWVLPPDGGAPAPIALAADPSQCWQLNKTAGATTCIGFCAYLGPCAAPGTPAWRRANATLQVASPGPAQRFCLDENRQSLFVQAYRTCIKGAPQQEFVADAAGRLHESWSGRGECVTAPGGAACPAPAPSPPPPPPPPPSSGPQIHNARVDCLHHAGWHDITAALTFGGAHHVFQGCPGAGGWHHAVSQDMLNWQNVGIDIAALPEPYGKSSPCSGFAVVDDEGVPCVGLRQCTGNWPGRRPQVVPLELRCAQGPSLSNWSAPEYIYWFYFARSLPYDPPRPWQDSDGKWYSLISGDACNATVPCAGGGAAYLHSSPRLRGPGANWTLLGPMWASNFTVLTPYTGAALVKELVTTGYIGNLSGDPAGGATRVLTNNVCGAGCCSCSTGWYLGTQAGGPGSAFEVDYRAPNATGMVDWGSFFVNASGPQAVGLAGLSSKGYGEGQFYSMARTLSEHPNQVAQAGRKTILGWIGGQTPAMQSLPRDLTLAADGSGLLQDFARELLALRKPAPPAGAAVLARGAGAGAAVAVAAASAGGGGSGGGAPLRSGQVEIVASFAVAAGAASPPPFGVRMLVDSSGQHFAEAGVNFTQQHVYVLSSAGPLLPTPSASEAALRAPALLPAWQAGATLVTLHAIVDHNILTVICAWPRWRAGRSSQRPLLLTTYTRPPFSPSCTRTRPCRQ